MKITGWVGEPDKVASDWLIVGHFEKSVDPPEALQGTPAEEIVRRLMTSKDLTGALGELVALPWTTGLASSSILLVGLGPAASFGPGPAFHAARAACKRLAGKPRLIVALDCPLPPEPTADLLGLIENLVQGAIVGCRGPDLRKAEQSRIPFGELRLVIPHRAGLDAVAIAEAIKRGEIIGEAVNLARDLANTPPSDKPPVRLAHLIREIAEPLGIQVSTWGEPRLRQERFGGLIGVSAGSAQPPAFVVLEYRNGGLTPQTALIGKGVTFDSGGLSIKPSASMEDMKADMTGAVVVLATMVAAARLGMKVNISGYLALTENMTGGAAMKLGDVLTMRNGKTVEVLNTDAEGRLILADALSYAAEQNPCRMVDLATLTGACIVALGTKVAGLFSSDASLTTSLLSACSATGERAWQLPLDDDYRELLKSQIADLKNIGGKWAGAITAAKFLQQFVGTTPWAHLDIAGPSWVETENTLVDAGATGCFVRTLVHWLGSQLPTN